MKRFQIITVLITLVLILLPKQMVYGQTEKSGTCCVVSQESENKCPQHSKKDNDHQKDCEDCSACTACLVHCEPVILLNKDFSTKLNSTVSSTKKLVFDYHRTYYSFNFNDIWQPPKLGKHSL